MTDTSKPDPLRFAGHFVSDANDHATTTGDGSRAALPAQPAPKRLMARRIKVTRRAAFLPDHPRAVHGLRGHTKGHAKR